MAQVSDKLPYIFWRFFFASLFYWERRGQRRRRKVDFLHHETVDRWCFHSTTKNDKKERYSLCPKERIKLFFCPLLQLFFSSAHKFAFPSPPKNDGSMPLLLFTQTKSPQFSNFFWLYRLTLFSPSIFFVYFSRESGDDP